MEVGVRILVILFGLCPLLVSAGQLYKCVDAAGDVSYQSTACQAPQRVERVIEFVPDAPGTASSALLVVSKPVRPQARRVSNGPRRTSTRTNKPRPSACSQAKAQRERRLEGLGLKRTFDDLSRIDVRVRAVCEGF
jgi:Domain of unknown function (DUF4124)